MRFDGTNSYNVCMIAMLLSLVFCLALAAHAEQKPATKSTAPAIEKAPPGTPSATTQKGAAPPPEKQSSQAVPGKTGSKEETAEEYAACSPDFPGEQVMQLMEFAGQISPDLAQRLRTIILKCDFDINNQLLGLLQEIRDEVSDTDFPDAEQQKKFLQTKAKEVELQILLSQKPVNEAEVKNLVDQLFDLRQQEMKDALVDLKKDADTLEKRIDEREKLKSQIVEKKMKEIISGEEAREGKSSDKLSWED
jgi:hypothetical protein